MDRERTGVARHGRTPQTKKAAGPCDPAAVLIQAITPVYCEMSKYCCRLVAFVTLRLKAPEPVNVF
ncbi:MAG TPA: hypothetical protein VK731_01595, partial [Candidatus Cybelea sp.]|nr:hypothetical protein [Candidatus Cybelea sp.]